MAFYADTLSWFRANKSLFLLLNGICLAEVQQIFSVLPDRVSNDTGYVLCRNHDSVISSYMTSHWVCNKSYTTGAISETGTVYPSGEPEFIPLAMSFCRIRWSIFSFQYSVLYIIVCPFVCWSLHCMSFFDLRLLITTLLSSTFSESHTT